MRQLDERLPSLLDDPAVIADQALISAAQTEPAAFARLYERYGDRVLNYCYYRLGTWEEAEDAAQQIFINAYAALPRYQDRGAESTSHVRSWLFTIAHHEVANRHRSQARNRDLPLEAAREMRDSGPSPEELAVAAERQDRIRGFLSHLSPDQRRTIELRLAGLTDSEIARVLGRSPGAIRATQFRAVARLRALLGSGIHDKGGSDV